MIAACPVAEFIVGHHEREETVYRSPGLGVAVIPAAVKINQSPVMDLGRIRSRDTDVLDSANIDEIKRAKTGSYVFVAADVTFADAIEDLKLAVNMS